MLPIRMYVCGAALPPSLVPCHSVIHWHNTKSFLGMTPRPTAAAAACCAAGQAVVVGGGYIGFEAAAGLSMHGLDVTMVFPETHLVSCVQ
jgi:NADPH-dependent 2,4-dienoyl-CoA reductase/sulfur reductase-like enzyme